MDIDLEELEDQIALVNIHKPPKIAIAMQFSPNSWRNSHSCELFFGRKPLIASSLVTLILNFQK